MLNRRDFLYGTAALSADQFAAKSAIAESTFHLNNSTTQVAPCGGYLGSSSGSLPKIDTHSGAVRTTPVVITDVGNLPYETDGDTKAFRRTAHVFERQIAPDKTNLCLGLRRLGSATPDTTMMNLPTGGTR